MFYVFDFSKMLKDLKIFTNKSEYCVFRRENDRITEWHTPKCRIKANIFKLFVGTPNYIRQIIQHLMTVQYRNLDLPASNKEALKVIKVSQPTSYSDL